MSRATSDVPYVSDRVVELSRYVAAYVTLILMSARDTRGDRSVAEKANMRVLYPRVSTSKNNWNKALEGSLNNFKNGFRLK